MHRDQKLLCTGAGGSVIAAICCFTPVLVILFGAIGLSWAVGYLDYVLLPMLAMLLGLTAWAAWRVWTARGAGDAGTADPDG
jgi:mercuric ion transport protein